MSFKYCVLIVLLSSTISGQTNHTEIIKAGRADFIESGLKDSNTSDLFLIPDVKNTSNAILLNGTTLSDIIANITFNTSLSSNKSSESNSPRKPRRVAPLSPPANVSSQLGSGNTRDCLFGDQRLLASQALISRNKEFALRISPSCDLQIIRVSDQTLLWRSNTSSALYPCSAYITRSGVLSLLDRNLHPIWKTDSNRGQDPATLMIGDDGNATITDQLYSALWKSNPDWRRDHINGGEITTDPVPLSTFNRMYTANVTNACQLAIRKMGYPQPIYTVGNSVKNATNCRLALGQSGDVSLRNEKGDVLWSNDEAVGLGEAPFQFRLLSNGTLALTSAHVPIWFLNENGLTLLA